MSQVLSQKTLKLLEKIREQGKINVYSFIKRFYRHESYRKIYTHIYQLEKRGYLEKYKLKDLEYLRASDKGIASLDTFKRERDGKWKMIIFDIPENKRAVRDYLRTKLKQLGFKRWQNSIWITPYRLPDDVVSELKELSKRYFIRLITVEHINNESGLKELF
ncbi:MAG: hypothetical protein AAB948_01035 [Patescibacteria group bacterium]